MPRASPFPGPASFSSLDFFRTTGGDGSRLHSGSKASCNVSSESDVSSAMHNRLFLCGAERTGDAASGDVAGVMRNPNSSRDEPVELVVTVEAEDKSLCLTLASKSALSETAEGDELADSSWRCMLASPGTGAFSGAKQG